MDYFAIKIPEDLSAIRKVIEAAFLQSFRSVLKLTFYIVKSNIIGFKRLQEH